MQFQRKIMEMVRGITGSTAGKSGSIPVLGRTPVDSLGKEIGKLVSPEMMKNFTSKIFSMNRGLPVLLITIHLTHLPQAEGLNVTLNVGLNSNSNRTSIPNDRANCCDERLTEPSSDKSNPELIPCLVLVLCSFVQSFNASDVISATTDYFLTGFTTLTCDLLTSKGLMVAGTCPTPLRINGSNVAFAWNFSLGNTIPVRIPPLEFSLGKQVRFRI